MAQLSADQQSPFDRLPDELLAETLSLAVSPNICLVSTRFSRVAMPLLYARYYRDRPSWHVDFLTPILQHEDLAKAVRTICYTSGGYTPDRCPSSRISDVIMRKFDSLRSSSSLSIPIPEENVETGPWYDDFGLFTIVCLTPNLEELHVKYTSYDGHFFDENEPLQAGALPIWLQPIVGAAMGKPFSNVHHFEKLRSLYINMYRTSLDNLWPIFRLSSLRSIQFAVLHSYLVNFPLGDLRAAAGTSLVESLDFHWSDLSSAQLSTIIGMCKMLRHLGYYSSRHSTNRVDGAWTEEIGEALLQHRHHLESLHVYIAHQRSDYAEAFASWSGRLGPLSVFSRLKIASYPMCGGILDGVRLNGSIKTSLPPTTIQKLEITTFNADRTVLPGMLTEILRSGRYTELKEIRIVLEVLFDRKMLDLRHFYEAFLDQGIQFSLEEKCSTHTEERLGLMVEEDEEGNNEDFIPADQIRLCQDMGTWTISKRWLAANYEDEEGIVGI